MSSPHCVPALPTITSTEEGRRSLGEHYLSLPSPLRDEDIRLSPRCSYQYQQNTYLTHEILLHVFQCLHTSVILQQAALWSLGERGAILVGPPVKITHICQFWREVTLSSPLLWNCIPMLLESGVVLSLANPAQVLFYHKLSAEVPLRVVIGTRNQLHGPGVNIQAPPQPHSIHLLASIAPRITELSIAFDYRSRLLSFLSNLSPHFSELARLTLTGSAQSPRLLASAGFWKSPHLTRIAMSIGETSFSFAPDLTSWSKLKEVAIRDEWEAALCVKTAHAFLTAAPNIIKFQCRVREPKSRDEGGTSSDDGQRLPALCHISLQELNLSFHGSLPDGCHTSTLLPALTCPNLTGFVFKMDWSASFDPATVTRWLRTESHHHLTRFECLALLNLEELLDCVLAMPLLQVLKCSGSVVANRSGLGGTAESIIDDRLLQSLCDPRPARTSLTITHFLGETVEEWG